MFVCVLGGVLYAFIHVSVQGQYLAKQHQIPYKLETNCHWAGREELILGPLKNSALHC